MILETLKNISVVIDCICVAILVVCLILIIICFVKEIKSSDNGNDETNEKISDDCVENDNNNF